MTINLTDTQYKALKAIEKHPGIRAAGIAKVLWPDSSMHTKVSSQGNGACRGKVAWLAGGSYVGKLKAKGLVRRYPVYPSNAYVRIEDLGRVSMLLYEEKLALNHRYTEHQKQWLSEMLDYKELKHDSFDNQQLSEMGMLVEIRMAYSCLGMDQVSNVFRIPDSENDRVKSILERCVIL